MPPAQGAEPGQRPGRQQVAIAIGRDRFRALLRLAGREHGNSEHGNSEQQGQAFANDRPEHDPPLLGSKQMCDFLRGLVLAMYAK